MKCGLTGRILLCNLVVDTIIVHTIIGTAMS